MSEDSQFQEPDLSNTFKRRIIAYPHPRYFKMIVSSVDKSGGSLTSFTCNLIQEHFNKMSDKEQKQLIENYPRAIKNFKTKNSY